MTQIFTNPKANYLSIIQNKYSIFSTHSLPVITDNSLVQLIEQDINKIDSHFMLFTTITELEDFYTKSEVWTIIQMTADVLSNNAYTGNYQSLIKDFHSLSKTQFNQFMALQMPNNQIIVTKVDPYFFIATHTVGSSFKTLVFKVFKHQSIQNIYKSLKRATDGWPHRLSTFVTTDSSLNPNATEFTPLAMEYTINQKTIQVITNASLALRLSHFKTFIDITNTMKEQSSLPHILLPHVRITGKRIVIFHNGQSCRITDEGLPLKFHLYDSYTFGLYILLTERQGEAMLKKERLPALQIFHSFFREWLQQGVILQEPLFENFRQKICQMFTNKMIGQQQNMTPQKSLTITQQMTYFSYEIVKDLQLLANKNKDNNQLPDSTTTTSKEINPNDAYQQRLYTVDH